MEKTTDRERKCVLIWLTRAEAADESLRETLKAEYARNKAMKYRTVVFESGNGSLLTGTKDLLSHALETLF